MCSQKSPQNVWDTIEPSSPQYKPLLEQGGTDGVTEIWIVPQEDMVKMKNVYNDRLTNNPKLIKAAKLAAEKHLFLSNLTPTLKTTIKKTVSTEFQKLTKESRHFPSIGSIGAAVEGEDDEDLATAPPPLSFISPANKRKLTVQDT